MNSQQSLWNNMSIVDRCTLSLKNSLKLRDGVFSYDDFKNEVANLIVLRRNIAKWNVTLKGITSVSDFRKDVISTIAVLKKIKSIIKKEDVS